MEEEPGGSSLLDGAPALFRKGGKSLPAVHSGDVGEPGLDGPAGLHVVA